MASNIDKVYQKGSVTHTQKIKLEELIVELDKAVCSGIAAHVQQQRWH